MADFYTKKSDTELANLIRDAVRRDITSHLDDTRNHYAGSFKLDDLRLILRKENIEFKLQLNDTFADSIGYKVLLKRPAPKVDPIISRHHDECECNLSENIYDDKCALCTQIKKVVMLRRRTVENGSTPEEETIAQRLAQKLIKQHGMMAADYVDKKYAKAAPAAVYQDANPHDPFGPRYQNYQYTPPPPRQTYRPYTKPTYASNAGNFGTAGSPSGSRMRANNPKGKQRMRHRPGDPLTTIG